MWTRLAISTKWQGRSRDFYFPARPRRFGKSLMVSTLAALFSGRRDIFSGLWIDNTDWDWQPHPVIEIDFNTINFDTPEGLTENLLGFIYRLSRENGIDNPYSTVKESFAALIIGLHRSRGKTVVVLIDEYEKGAACGGGEASRLMTFLKPLRSRLPLKRQNSGGLKNGNDCVILREEM